MSKSVVGGTGAFSRVQCRGQIVDMNLWMISDSVTSICHFLWAWRTSPLKFDMFPCISSCSWLRLMLVFLGFLCDLSCCFLDPLLFVELYTPNFSCWWYHLYIFSWCCFVRSYVRCCISYPRFPRIGFRENVQGSPRIADQTMASP